jgi:hypothetical protein
MQNFRARRGPWGHWLRVLVCEGKGDESPTFRALKGYINYMILFIFLSKYKKLSFVRYIYRQ